VILSQGYLQRLSAPRLQVSRGAAIRQGPRGWRLWFRDLPLALRVTMLSLVILALMGPQSIHARRSTEVQGIDIVLTLDMSLSMQANDIIPDRFRATKEVVDDFIVHRPSDRIGAVVFGESAYTLLPLTLDKRILRETIGALELGSIGGRGTAIGNALATSLNRLRESDAASMVVILLTDG
jgi:Ca-activated chloride channel family protein